MKFKVTSGFFKKFVHVEMLIDEMESVFGILNVQTRTDPGLFSATVYITLGPKIQFPLPYKMVDIEEVERWWLSTDRTGKNYKIERLD